MTPLLHSLDARAAAILGAELNTLWIGALAVALAWLTPRCWPRLRAATRQCLWFGVLLAVLLAPLGPRLFPHRRPVPAQDLRVRTDAVILLRNRSLSADAVTLRIPDLPAPSVRSRGLLLNLDNVAAWPLLFAALWFALLVFQLARLGRAWRSLTRLRRRALPLALAWPVPPRRRAQLLSSPEVHSPLALGYRRPAVILPTRHLAALSATERDHVLLHELAHLERRDDWLMLAENLVAAVALLHPLVALALARIGREREMACDEWVVARLTQAATVSANVAVQSLVDRRETPPLAPLPGIAARHRSSTALAAAEGCAPRPRGRSGRSASGPGLPAAPARISAANRGELTADTAAAAGYAASLLRLYELRWSAGAARLAPGMFGPGRSRLGERVDALLGGAGFAARISRVGLASAALLVVGALFAAAAAPPWIHLALPQAFGAHPVFEAASIKPGDPNARGSGMRVQPGQLYHATNAPLKLLIGWAYDINTLHILGATGWMNTAPWTIEARGPDAPPGAAPLSVVANQQQTRLMLRALLAERFALKTHSEKRLLRVYFLTVYSTGPRLTVDNRLPELASRPDGALKIPPPPPPPAKSDLASPAATNARVRLDARVGFMAISPGEMSGTAQPLANLASMLSSDLGAVVIDQTGLTERYDFDLKWTPGSEDANMAVGQGGDGMKTGLAPTPVDSPVAGPSIFTALEQQLGLKLSAGKAPVEVLVIDHAQKPTGN